MGYRPSYRKLFFVVVAAWAWAACSAPPTGRAGAGDTSPRAYQCGDLRLEARFREDSAELLLPDRVLRLDATVSASGALYADDAGNAFWIKGDGAMLTLSGRERSDCRVTGSRSPWVAARERGVVYRAVGQEPGWLAEVGPGDTPALRVMLHYGQRNLTVARGCPLGDGDGFLGHAGDVPVVLRIMPEPCRDSMSGETFDTRAELRAGDDVYAGCGRFL